MTRDTRAESAAIREILHQDWDPIGGVPVDEYDSYVWPVYGLLIRDAGRDEVTAWLRRAAAVHIACPVPEARLTAVVDKLMALGFATRTPPA